MNVTYEYDEYVSISSVKSSIRMKVKECTE